MNLGSNDTYTASNFDEETVNYTNKIYEARNSKYVEILSKEGYDKNKDGLAIAETAGWFDSGKYYYTSQYQYRILTRRYLFGFGQNGSNLYNGIGTNFLTYRPVIWN